MLHMLRRIIHTLPTGLSPSPHNIYRHYPLRMGHPQKIIRRSFVCRKSKAERQKAYGNGGDSRALEAFSGRMECGQKLATVICVIRGRRAVWTLPMALGSI